MPDFKLKAQTPLGGFNQDTNGVLVSELTGLSIVSVATPAGQESRLADSIAQVYDIVLPEIGRYTESQIDNTRFLGLQVGQHFAIFKNTDDHALGHIANKIGNSAYYTNQSDSWAILKVSGIKAVEALERICPLDLHREAFLPYCVARTVMEHLSVIIMRESDNEFVLLSPRSSAQSFLHMILTSIDNIS